MVHDASQGIASPGSAVDLSRRDQILDTVNVGPTGFADAQDVLWCETKRSLGKDATKFSA